MRNVLKGLINYHKNNQNIGIYSACSANDIVIRSVIKNAKKNNSFALIEATANQCNQFGGYTGMTPLDFKVFVESIALEEYFPLEKLILGGDHLGPLIWADYNEGKAMELAKDLIYHYVKAGYTKIHIDTSMRLKGDLPVLTDEIIAKRSAELAVVARNAYEELKELNKDIVKPVFVIGSEVPIPGGGVDEEELKVTSPDQLKETIKEFRKQFEIHEVLDIWEEVIAVVVQPGVEFSDEKIDDYNRDNARGLVEELKNYDLVFEGHSTDYQKEDHLIEMVEDGIKILKVGPGLTFALREGLFAIAEIEKNILAYKNIEQSDFIETIEKEMLSNDTYWKNYYLGTDNDKFVKRKFSFSDRIRYYLPNDNVVKEMTKMFDNLEGIEIPLSLLSQYMPSQYEKVRQGLIKNNAMDLVISRVDETIEKYMNATSQHKLGEI